jgi:hypothetical protein
VADLPLVGVAVGEGTLEALQRVGHVRDFPMGFRLSYGPRRGAARVANPANHLQTNRKGRNGTKGGPNRYRKGPIGTSRDQAGRRTPNSKTGGCRWSCGRPAADPRSASQRVLPGL